MTLSHACQSNWRWLLSTVVAHAQEVCPLSSLPSPGSLPVPGCMACLPSGAVLVAPLGRDAQLLLAGRLTQTLPCRAPILDAVAADLANTGQQQARCLHASQDAPLPLFCSSRAARHTCIS